MKFRSLTNTRPVKEVGSVLVANSAKGSLKISDAAARALGLTDGDYVDVAEHPEQAGVFYVGKGFIKTKEVTEEDGSTSTKTVEKNGSKLSKNGSYFGFSSAGAWTMVGQEDAIVTYPLTDEVEEDESGNKYIKLGSAEVETVEKTEKAESGESAQEDSADRATAPAPAGADLPGNNPASISVNLDEL